MKFERKNGFSLLEVLFSIMIIAIILVPSITAIQVSRVRMRSISQNLIAQNLATSVMEMVKRAGFDDYSYGSPMSIALDGDLPSALLDFPRYDDAGDTPMVDEDLEGNPLPEESTPLPAGPPGGATNEEFAAFLSDYRTGETTMEELAESDIIALDTNYYFYGPEQIAAMNGYESTGDIPEEKEDSLFDPQFAWGYYANFSTGPDGVDNTTDDLQHIAVVVKWIDTRTGDRRFTVLEAWVVRQAHRLSLP